MPRTFDFNRYSLSTKVILTIIFFIFIFLFIRFSLVIPKIKENAYERELKNISKSLFYVKEQMKMAVKAIRMQTFSQIEYKKERLASELKDIKGENLSREELIKTLESSSLSKFCAFRIQENDFEYKKIKGKDLFKKNNPLILDNWQSFKKKDENKIVQRKRIYFFYNTKLSKETLLTLGCHSRLLNPDHEKFEEELRSHIQKNLSLLQSTINSKTIILWINPKLLNDDSKPLYEKDEKKRQKKYRISKLSNTRTLTTGKLTAKEILKARDKTPLEYSLNGKELVTWIENLSIEGSSNLYTLIYTVNKEDILKKSSLNLFILLPETLLAIIIAFVLFLLIFNKLFKKINTITKTAKQVNSGDKNIRTKIKGEDDIGQLGIAFDSMLDFFENNIKILDKKVEEKTKELKNSLEEKEILLEEKETLLKEIHHRVKNNLAKTITLIELQENEVKDEKTKKALIDIKERIYTMELLHRKLYESTNLNKISLKTYVIELIQTISKAYTNDEQVQIKYDIDDINFNIETAMPCGLILNELVTNSFKYAFKDNPKPTLEIKITKQGQYFEMSIKDNGKGIKDEFISTNKTLGLKLINTITKFQLQGTFKYKYEEGALFIIKGQIKEDIQ